MPDNRFIRYRFSVPKADKAVTQWAEAQANLSMSLRTLIRESIRQHGVIDATCMPVTPGTPPEVRPAEPRAARQEAPAPQPAPAAPVVAPPPVQVRPVPQAPVQYATHPQVPAPAPAPAPVPPVQEPPAASPQPFQRPMDDSELENMLGIS